MAKINKNFGMDLDLYQYVQSEGITLAPLINLLLRRHFFGELAEGEAKLEAINKKIEESQAQKTADKVRPEFKEHEELQAFRKKQRDEKTKKEMIFESEEVKIIKSLKDSGMYGEVNAGIRSKVKPIEDQ